MQEGRLMIIDPDFLDHWRTRWLVDELAGDEFAPFYLIRLWGHCQTRKATRFEIPAPGLKGICKCTCSGQDLERALTACGYLVRDGDAVEVLKWAEQNASLMAAWSNGGKGGRPPKGKPGENPADNPGVSDGLPMGGPQASRGDPGADPQAAQTKPIRLDEIGDTSLRSVSPSGKSKSRKAYTPEFEEAWAAYPRRPGDNKGDAFKAWNARLKAGAAHELMIDGARRYAAWAAVNVSEPKYLKQGATFFGPAEHFLSDWTVSGTSSALVPAETAHQRSMRERAEQMSGGLASAKPRSAKPMEVTDV